MLPTDKSGAETEADGGVGVGWQAIKEVLDEETNWLAFVILMSII